MLYIKEQDTKSRVLFLSFGSPWHQDIWNTLSVETLAGDIYGEFSSQVECWHKRIISNSEIEEVIDFLSNNSVDIIGFSIEIRTIDVFDELFQKIVERKSEVDFPLLVLGGKMPTYAQEFFANKYLINNAKSIIVSGDGEYPFREIIKYIWHETKVDQICNSIWKDSEGNTIWNRIYENNNFLVHPPMLLNTRPEQVNILETTRGCYCSCSYCAQGYRQWDPFPIDRVIENLERLFSNNISNFEFVDNDFLGGRNKKHIERARIIAECIEKLSLKYNFNAKYRVFTNPLVIARYKEDEKYPNKLMRDLLIYMKKTGLERLYIGIESGSIEQRKRYNRKDTLEECVASINLLRELDITIDVGFIMFDPQMDLTDLRENINFFKKMKLIEANTYPFSDIHLTMNTPLVEEVKKDNLITGICLDELCYEYTFKNESVSLIAKTILTFALKTGKLFQIMKYITKEQFNKMKKTEAEIFAWESVIENALIYLDMMEEMVNKYETGVEEYSEEINKARNRLLDLLNRIETNLVLFDKNMDYYSKIENELCNARFQLEIDTCAREYTKNSMLCD